MSGILIIGAGGQGKTAADILLIQGLHVQGFLDDNPALWGTSVIGLPVLGEIDCYASHRPDGLVMGIGGNKARSLVAERLGWAVRDLWRNAIHPCATISPCAKLGIGVVIAANAVVNPDVVVDDFASIAAGALVTHDDSIGSYTHLGPGVCLGGSVTIGQGVLLGVGAVVIPGCTVGDWAVVGAGAVVVKDIPPHVVAKGLPARWEEMVEKAGVKDP